jgi:hypothetical protein
MTKKKLTKPLHPEGCERNLAEAIRLLSKYTGGSCDVFELSDQLKTAQRADIMRAYCGREVPFGGCKPMAIFETLAEHANELKPATPIESAKQLAAYCKSFKIPDKVTKNTEPTAESAVEKIAGMKAAAAAADDRGTEAAADPSHQSASAGETAMATAAATKKKSKITKAAAAKKSAKPAKVRKAGSPGAKPKAFGVYQAWELIRGLKHAGAPLEGVNVVLAGLKIPVSLGFLRSVYNRKGDAGAVSGKMPTKIADEHLKELKKNYADAFKA